MDDLNLNENKVPWNMYDLIIIFAGALFLSQLFLILLTNFFTLQTEIIFGFIGGMVQDLTLLGLTVLILQNKYNYSIRKNLLTITNLRSVIINGIFGGVAILFAVILINSILASFLIEYFKYQPPQQKVITLLLQSNELWLFLSYAFLIVIVAPIVEEIFFRGLVYSYLRERYGVTKAIIFSAAFFGVMHLSAWAFIGTFLAGLGLAYLFEKSKSLYTSIIGHMVWNGIITFIFFIVWRFELLQI